MRVLALDDCEAALKLMSGCIAEVLPSAEAFAFTKPSKLLEFAKDNDCEIAFLDIQMWGMNGLAVAKALKDFYPKINIIFVTAHCEYASEAFEVHPSGYVLKPVSCGAIRREVENLRHPVDLKNTARIYAQTFGNFELFSYGVPIKFKYTKTKELIAYLIDRNGAAINMNGLCAVLWEEKQDSANLKAYLRKLIRDLIMTLRESGADDIVLKRHNGISVITDRIVCDAYGFMKGVPWCVNAYFGEYMAQYSWAEITAAALEKNF